MQDRISCHAEVQRPWDVVMFYYPGSLSEDTDVDIGQRWR